MIWSVFKMVDPKGGVSATHYTTSGDYTLTDGLSGTHNVICEKVLDQYKVEREICDEYERNSYVFYTWPFYTNMIEIKNNDGYKRELEYVGKTTYKRAHAICQAKGKMRLRSDFCVRVYYTGYTHVADKNMTNMSMNISATVNILNMVHVTWVYPGLLGSLLAFGMRTSHGR